MKQQVKLTQLMHNLLASGFQLSEMIHFLERSNLVDQKFVKTMRSSLADGQTLSQILTTLHFSKSVVTQIALADYHGNTCQTLALVAKNLTSKQQISRKMIAVSTYPAILVITLLGMVTGLKTYLLPQVDTTNMAGVILNYIPLIVIMIVTMLSASFPIASYYLKRTSPFRTWQRIGRLPCVGKFVKLYLSAFYAREWGNLIKQGLEMRQILEIMLCQEDRLFQEIGQNLLTTMQLGKPFHSQIATYHFFTAELSLIIEYGEMKAKLGTELLVYSDELWQSFFDRLELSMTLIQPLIFLFVALMIVLIYAAMLLPIYAQMNIGL